jgi:hypothetical protein
VNARYLPHRAFDCAAAQAQQGKSFVGTVTSVKADGTELEVKPDGVEPPAVTVRITSAMLAQKVAPGRDHVEKRRGRKRGRPEDR